MATSEPSDYQCGDIVVVPFPFSDRLAEKRRPALVVSSDAVFLEGLVWLAMVTSAKQSARIHDHAIRDRAITGLKVDCIIRPIKIASIETSKVVRKIGRLDNTECEIVISQIRKLLGSTTI